MSSARMRPTTLEDEFSKILKRLSKKGDCALGDTKNIEAGLDTAPIFLDDEPVGSVLRQKSLDGQTYVRRAMIQKDVLNIKGKKTGQQYEPADSQPQTYKRFVNLLYVRGKGRVDENYKVPL